MGNEVKGKIEINECPVYFTSTLEISEVESILETLNIKSRP